MSEPSRPDVARSFGEVPEEVALSFPISKPRLLGALVRFDDAVRRRERYLRREGDVYVHPSAILVCLPVSTWAEVEADAGLLPYEAVAVRAAHHRLATSLIGGSYERRRRNLLVLSASEAAFSSD